MLGKDGFIKLRANTRIAVLCSQLRYVVFVIDWHDESSG